MDLATAFPRWPTQGLFMLTRSRKAQLTSPRMTEQQRRLSRHSTLRLPNRESVLQVISGCIWITRDGCATDWVLEAGQVFRQQTGASVLVHALRDAEFLLDWGSTGDQNE